MSSTGIVKLEAAEDAAVFGGKAFHLGASLRARLPVPPGYAVSIDALARVAAGEPAACAAMEAACATLRAPFAARSSAVGEDGADASFAGQYLSLLNLVDGADVIDALCQVHRSAQSAAVRGYREKKGITGPVQIAAVVQQLVDPECAGVLFTRNPVTGADEYVIEAAWGLGEAVVAGLITPDQHRLAPDGRVLQSRLGDKDIAVRRAADGGTQEVPVEAALVATLCLDEKRLARLHTLARECQAHFGARLDLEWAFVADQLYLLQTRPISTGKP